MTSRPIPADRPCRARRAAADPGPLDDRFYDLVEARFRRLMRDNPIVGDVLRDPRRRRSSSATAGATRSSRSSRPTGSTSPRSRRSTPPASPPTRPLRARPRGAQRPARRSSRPTSCASGSAARWRSTRSATACSCCSPAITRRSPSGSTRSPVASKACPGTSRRRAIALDRPQVRLWQGIEIESAGQLPALFDELVAAGRGVLGPAEQRRLERAAAAANVAVDLYTTWLEGTPRRRHRCVRRRARAPRRAGRAARVRRARRRRRSSRSASRSSRRSARRGRRSRARSTRTPTWPTSSRGSSRTTRRPSLRPSRSTARRCVARAPISIEHDLVIGPRRRADRRHRDARVPAQRHPVRRVLLAGRVRSRLEGDLHRHPVGPRRRRTPCASTTAPRSATRASTRRTRATTSSSMSHAAIRR